MKPIHLIPVAAFAMAATPALAVNWVYLYTNDSGTDFYYDSDTIKRSGSQVAYWEKTDHSRDKTRKERQRIKRRLLDCVDRTDTLLHVTVYYPDGTTKSATWKTYEQEADPVLPGTVGEFIMEAVCAAAR